MVVVVSGFMHVLSSFSTVRTANGSIATSRNGDDTSSAAAGRGVAALLLLLLLLLLKRSSSSLSESKSKTCLTGRASLAALPPKMPVSSEVEEEDESC